MATILEVWERLDKLIRERTTTENGTELLFFDKMELSKKGTKVKRGAKYIIGAIDRGAAASIAIAINDFLLDDDNRITSKEDQKPKQYKLNVKIVDDVGPTVQLKRTAAKSTRIYSYDAVMDYLKNKEEQETGDHEDTAEECRTAQNKLAQHYLMTGDEYYYVTAFSGTAYRVSYHDVAERKNKQVSVGDILILVGATEIQTSGVGREGRNDKLTADSADVIAKVWWTFIRVLPEDLKEELRQKALKKAKGKA